MKDAEKIMKDFMTTLDNMKKYQGVDITESKTYFNDYNIVHHAFSIEKNIVATFEAEEVDSVTENSPKLLKLTSKK